MASEPISNLNGGVETVTVDAADLLAIVDVSDTTQAPTGTTKPIAISKLTTFFNSALSFLSSVNLGYTASPTNGTVTNDGGTDSTIPLFDTASTNAGLVAGSNGATTTFLRADGTWAAAGGGNTIYNANDTLTGNRTVSLGAFGLGIGAAPVAGKALRVGGDMQVDGFLQLPASHGEKIKIFPGANGISTQTSRYEFYTLGSSVEFIFGLGATGAMTDMVKIGGGTGTLTLTGNGSSATILNGTGNSIITGKGTFGQVSAGSGLGDKIFVYEAGNVGFGIQTGKFQQITQAAGSIDFVWGKGTSAALTELMTLDAGTGDLNLQVGSYAIGGTTGITETLNFGGGTSGQVASITVTGGIITSRTLVP